MADLKISKTRVHGLVSDLEAVNLLITTETSNRQASDNTLQTNINTVQSNLNTEVTNRTTADTGLSNRLDVIEGGDSVAGSVAKALKDAKDYTDTLENGKVSTIEALVNVINGTGEGSFKKAIEDLINGSPQALNTLKELADELASNKSLDEALATLVASNHSAIKGSVTTQYDDLGKIEEALNLINANESTVNSVRYLIKIVQDDTNTRLVKANNLSDLTDISVARTNIDVYSKSEVDEVARLGGVIPVGENLLVTNAKIVLTNTPKNDYIINSTIRYVDVTNHFQGGSNALYEVPVIKDTSDSSGKTYILQPNQIDDYDGLTVLVQYLYTPTV